MDDAGIRRRLDAIIILQVLLIALALPGGPGIALLIGAALAVFIVLWATVSLLARSPGED